jgi:hypothetical protein
MTCAQCCMFASGRSGSAVPAQRMPRAES